MDRSEVERITEKYLRLLAQQWQLLDWHIEAEFGPVGDEHVAGVTLDINYRRATIRLDPERQEDERKVIEHLQHECLHLVLAPFTVYRAISEKQATNGLNARAEAELWAFAVEQAIKNLEMAVGRSVIDKLVAEAGE